VAAAFRKHKVLACAGYCFRYRDTVTKARQYLKGRVISLVSGHCLGGLPDTWWWRQRKRSGGQFLEQTTHAVDLIRYLCGEVSEVFGLASSGCMTKVKDYDIDDSSAVVLRLKSGATAAITSTCVNGRHNRFGLEIVTPEATLHFDGATLAIHQDGMGITQESAVDMYREENEAFVEVLRTGKQARIRSTYNDARKTLAVTLAANESMRSGLPVKP
jgi:predicted dehydrogenase